MDRISCTFESSEEITYPEHDVSADRTAKAGDVVEPYVVTDSHVIRMVQLNPSIDSTPKFRFKTGRFPKRVKWVSSAF